MNTTAQTIEISQPTSLSGIQISRLKEAVEGLSNQQINWASGYLAGLSDKVSTIPQGVSTPSMTILYASQGGNARTVAEELATTISSHGFSPRLVSAADYKPRELNKESLLIVVISTQGEGEPPENARALFNYLKGNKPPNIEGLKYAIFGLGDSSYERFCQAAVDLDQQLSRLGAVSALTRIDADIDFRTQTTDWYKQVTALIDSTPPTEPARIISLPHHAPVAKRYDRNHPYTAEVLDNRPITTVDAVATTHHLALEINTQTQGDRYGWVENPDTTWHLTLYIENGRIEDRPGAELLQGLRKIAQIHEGDFRITPNQNLVITNISSGGKSLIESIAQQHGLLSSTYHSTRLASIACVALPTCPQAMAEAERYFPDLLKKIELLEEKHAIADNTIVIRMTGCANGCARPYVAEIGLVGKGPGRYNLHLGGDGRGLRLNRLYKKNLNEANLLVTLDELLQQYAANRNSEERFGDYAVRSGLVNPTPIPLEIEHETA